MNTNLPISQADLEAMIIGPARAAAEMEGSWAMTVDAREPRSGTKKDFQSALMLETYEGILRAIEGAQ